MTTFTFRQSMTEGTWNTRYKKKANSGEDQGSVGRSDRGVLVVDRLKNATEIRVVVGGKSCTCVIEAAGYMAPWLG